LRRGVLGEEELLRPWRRLPLLREQEQELQLSER